MPVRTRKSRWIYVIHFIVSFLVFTSVWAIVLIYHGPFTNLKYYIVSMSMSTKSNQMFATWFLSQDEINKILSYMNATVKDTAENPNNVTVKNKGTQTNSGSGTTQNHGVKIEDVSGTDFKGKIMIIDNPSRVTLGLAPKLGEIGAPLSEIVRTNNAVGGINAGGFQDDNFTGTGAQPDGIVIQDGFVKFDQNLSTYSVIGFTRDNVLLVSNHMTIDQIKNSNLRCAVSFGPALIIDGQPLVEQGGASLQPRSAIAQRKDGSVLLLAIDGRQAQSKGVNFKTLQDILMRYGAYNAANLDGGSSTTMNYMGKTINNPCDITGERSIATAILLMPGN